MKASKKSLAGVVYEQEKEETETKSVPGDLKKLILKLEQIFKQSIAYETSLKFSSSYFCVHCIKKQIPFCSVSVQS